MRPYHFSRRWHARSAVAALKERGLDRALTEAFGRGVPILGICLGAQIVLTHSEEGNTGCLGLIEGDCRKITVDDPSLKIPHMGWNEINVTRSHFILKDFILGSQVYFVHSYYPLPADPREVFATFSYGKTFPCAIGRGNLFATQFHLEKSGPVGLAVLKILPWDGAHAK